MRDPLRDAEFNLRIKLPGELEGKVVQIVIPELEARCLRPLPPNREIPWCWNEREAARLQEVQRWELASHVLRKLESEIYARFKAMDTVNGHPNDQRQGPAMSAAAPPSPFQGPVDPFHGSRPEIDE